MCGVALWMQASETMTFLSPGCVVMGHRWFQLPALCQMFAFPLLPANVVQHQSLFVLLVSLLAVRRCYFSNGIYTTGFSSDFALDSSLAAGSSCWASLGSDSVLKRSSDRFTQLRAWLSWSPGAWEDPCA